MTEHEQTTQDPLKMDTFYQLFQKSKKQGKGYNLKPQKSKYWVQDSNSTRNAPSKINTTFNLHKTEYFAPLRFLM